jgi:hypothetical protein
MPLPSSGALTLTAIRDELNPGAANPVDLLFFAGKTYAAPGGTRTISATPAMTEFYDLQRMSVTCANVSGNAAGFPASGNVGSSLTAPSVIGGVAPLTYAWSLISVASGATPTCNLPTAAVTGFQAFVDSGDASISTWRLTVTDNGGAQATVDIQVTLVWISLS